MTNLRGHHIQPVEFPQLVETARECTGVLECEGHEHDASSHVIGCAIGLLSMRISLELSTYNNFSLLDAQSKGMKCVTGETNTQTLMTGANHYMKARTLVVRGLSSLARLVEKLGEDQAVEPGSNATPAPGTPRSVSPAVVPSSYRQVPSFFTSSEGTFYLRLAEAVHGRCIVMSKVRLADLVEAVGDEQQRFKGFARVAQKHVDFVLLNPIGFAVIAAIELDGNTHLKGKQNRRDESKARVLESAGIPLLRFSSLEVLPTAMIADRLRVLLPGDINAPIEDTASPALPEAAAEAPACRKCGKTMVRRESERGPFWGCPGFPKCWSTIKIQG